MQELRRSTDIEESVQIDWRLIGIWFCFFTFCIAAWRIAIGIIIQGSELLTRIIHGA
jgi:hypothetical protein